MLGYIIRIIKNKLANIDDKNKIKLSYNIFKELAKPISHSLYKYNHGFYKVYLEKCQEYKNPSSIQYTGLSDSWKKSFIKIYKRLLSL